MTIPFATALTVSSVTFILGIYIRSSPFDLSTTLILIYGAFKTSNIKGLSALACKPPLYLVLKPLTDPEDADYTPNDGTFPGPYLYDTDKPYVIGDIVTTNDSELNTGSNNVFQVADSSEFPDEQGNLVFGIGTSHEEGPVPYIARPSSNSLMISPAYKFKNTHPPGTDISLIVQNSPFIPSKDGSDYPFYITDSISGRIYAEELIRTVAATGIRVVITILYPNDIGLGKWGTDFSEKTEVWGDNGWAKKFQINEDD